MTIVLNGTTGITTPGTDSTTLVVNSNNISAVNSLGFRNRIINGDMRIDQRNAGASVTQITSLQYPVDRWLIYGTVTSKFTGQRNAGSVTPPAGFTNYLGITSSSAYSVLTGDVFGTAHRIEGFNTADLAWGTANAQTVTVSFWVRSSLTGTFGGALQNNAQDRSYPFTYTISAANTWEQKIVTIAGDTSGTWATDNSIGIGLIFGLGAGSTFSATAGAWGAGNKWTATGAVSVVGTNGATFYITGVQLEAGTVASPFERRDYGRELIMCQRYAIQTNGEYTGQALSGTLGCVPFIFPTTMRAAPTATLVTNGNLVSASGTGLAITGIATSVMSVFTGRLNLTVASGLVAGDATFCSSNATLFSAEL